MVRATVRPVVRARIHIRISGKHDVPTEDVEHGQRVFPHVVESRVLPAQAPSTDGQALRVPGPREPAAVG